MDAFNYKMGQRISELGKIHGLYMVCRNFEAGLNSQVSSPELRAFLEQLLIYFLIDSIETQLPHMLEFNVVSQMHISKLKKVKNHITEKISPDLLVLVEALKMEDWNLKSAIGHENGQPYDNLYHSAKNLGMLNKYVDNVHPAMKEFYLPWRKQHSQSLAEKSLVNLT